MTPATIPTKEPTIKIIPRSKEFRPLSKNTSQYAAPRPVSYRSPSPYAHIANLGWGQKPTTESNTSSN